MKPISCSWPVKFSDFKKDETSEKFSRGKCAVFFKGETADHRYFGEDFSEAVIKTLPYAPIVSHYDAEKDDFVGHSTNQEIYGIVDPCVEPTFEVLEDGNTWAVVDAVFYTERPDIGDIAKKIEGHSQSLELDPKTVKYVINYDEKKHFKNVEFTAGSIIGLSVLGKEQKPAFTGSSFFACDETFEEKMKILKDYCENKNSQTQGGNQMNLQEFMALSWGEISCKVEQAISAEYGNEYYTYVVDMFDSQVVFRAYSYIDGISHLFRMNYAVSEDGNVSLDGIEEVHVAYEPIATKQEQGAENASFDGESNSATEETLVEDTSSTISVETSAEPTSTETTPAATATEDNFEEETVISAESTGATEGQTNEGEGEPAPQGEDAASNSVDAETQQAANDFNADSTQIQKVGAENENSQETNSGSATFTESERAEFEALKREKKVNLLNSFTKVLSKEDYDKFMADIDSKSYDELNMDLLKAYKSKTEQERETQSFKPRAFAYAPNYAENQNSALYEYLKRL